MSTAEKVEENKLVAIASGMLYWHLTFMSAIHHLTELESQSVPFCP